MEKNQTYGTECENELYAGSQKKEASITQVQKNFWEKNLYTFSGT